MFSAIRVTFKQLFSDVRGIAHDITGKGVAATCAATVCVAAGAIAQTSQNVNDGTNAASDTNNKVMQKVASPGGGTMNQTAPGKSVYQ